MAQKATVDPVLATMQLDGDVLGLQIVLQRILARLALSSATDITQIMRTEHAEASKMLAQASIKSLSSESSDLMRSRAQEMLDQIYGLASTFRLDAPPARE
jgi:hypothetical protein